LFELIERRLFELAQGSWAGRQPASSVAVKVDASAIPPCATFTETAMIKKLLLAIATLVATMTFALAQVEINKADVSALDSVKGIGPAKSKAIIDERAKGGDFKDWADLEKRVKGIREKTAAKLSEAGLQVNGKSLDGAPMKTADAKSAKSGAAKSAAAKSAGSKAGAAPAAQ